MFRRQLDQRHPVGQQLVSRPAFHRGQPQLLRQPRQLRLVGKADLVAYQPARPEHQQFQ